MIDRACISLNARCNLKCVYCHFAKKKNNAKSLINEFSERDACVFCQNLEKYIKLKNIQSFKLGIVGSGEPLLSFGALRTIVNYFVNSDLRNIVKMYVISNGTLLNQEIVEFFYENRGIIELDISLDGDPKINKRLRGCFPDLEIYKNKFGQMSKINAVVTKEIIDNQDRILKYFVDNDFAMVNFSKVFAIDDASIAITDNEYERFLEHAQSMGIISRQNIKEKKYDCAKYGRLCGVGRNNIFITKTGIYPCGRFMNIEKYLIGKWDDAIEDVELKLNELKPCPDGECYYEYNKVESI